MTRVEAGDDADAALIDRLYGGPDSGADDELEGLRMVRGLIARVRDEAPAVEPPQAVSARLLQAAEELAPKRAAAAAVEPERPGAWARLRSWFAGVAMHPAMAAAATLVVVAGATALWMRRGGEVAEPTKQSERSHASADHEEALEQPAAPGEGAGSATVVADPEPAAIVAADGEKQVAEPDRMRVELPGKPQIASAGTDEKPARKAGGKPNDFRGGLAKSDKAAGDEVVARGEGDSAGADDGDRDEDDSEAPMKVAQTTSVGGTAQEAPPPPAKAEKKEKKPDPPAEPTPDAVATEREEVSGAAMAAEYTRQAIAAAKKNNCKLVERLAAKAKDADAAYYQRSFVPQADIKKCRAKKDPARR